MPRPTLIEDLNVPANINNIEKRLGYFTRRLKLAEDAYNAGGQTGADLNILLGIAREVGQVQHDARYSSTGNGPPSWASNPDTHWVDDAVVWPPGLVNSPAHVRTHFLLSLEGKLKVNGVNYPSDLTDKLEAARAESANDEGWD